MSSPGIYKWLSANIGRRRLCARRRRFKITHLCIWSGRGKQRSTLAGNNAKNAADDFIEGNREEVVADLGSLQRVAPGPEIRAVHPLQQTGSCSAPPRGQCHSLNIK